jgi:hypothetical protein
MLRRDFGERLLRTPLERDRVRLHAQGDVIVIDRLHRGTRNCSFRSTAAAAVRFLTEKQRQARQKEIFPQRQSCPICPHLSHMRRLGRGGIHGCILSGTGLDKPLDIALSFPSAQ